jgi:phospholipid/cholesterol/gamma-HCH transport system substrate-binding protein
MITRILERGRKAMFEIKKHLIWSKMKVGLVVTAALVIVLITVIFAGSLETLFTNNITLFAQVKDVRGLRSGSPVWLSGIEIGSVRDINLHQRYGTLVVMLVRKDASEFIKKDSTATVMTMGLLGDKYVEISHGSEESEKISPEEVLQGKVQLELGDLYEATSGSLSRVSSLMEQLGMIVGKIDKSEGTVGKMLNDPSVFNNINAAAKSLAVTLKEIETSQGSFRKLVRDPSLYNNLDKASRNLNAVLEGIEAGRGTAGMLLKDEATAKQLRESINGLNQAVLELRDMIRDMKANPKKYLKFSVF